MWNLEKLFATVPEIHTMPKINLGEGIEAFKFKSAPYGHLDATWPFAAIGVPSGYQQGEKYPAVILIHGGAGQVFPEWIKYWNNRGFVAVALDMFGYELNEEGKKVLNPEAAYNGEPHGSLFSGVKSPRQSWVYHAVYNIIMLNNILRARNDVDTDKIVMTGISWGAYITNIVAGVDHRIAAFAPVYGCGYAHEDAFWLKNAEESELCIEAFGGHDGHDEWIKLYDPSSYLPNATRPMMFVSGIGDGCFSAVNRMRSADLAPVKKYYSQRSDLEHGHYWDLTPEINAFFRHIIYGEATLTKLGDIIIEDGVAKMTSSNDLFESVNFVYTLSKDKNSHDWKWESVQVAKENGAYSYHLPDGVTAYCFEVVSDEKKGTGDKLFRQSTKIVFA
jgi:dienelactone hydrolase